MYYCDAMARSHVHCSLTILVITLILFSSHLPVMFVQWQYCSLFCFNEVPGKACNCSKCYFQHNMHMTEYIKSKWSNNSPHYILQDITYLDAKAHILSFTPPSGVPLHKVCLLFVTLSTIYISSSGPCPISDFHVNSLKFPWKRV